MIGAATEGDLGTMFLVVALICFCVAIYLAAARREYVGAGVAAAIGFVVALVAL